ncbi:hypothetical protein PR048_008359 [Dryococelus australis]|uniref:Uncharacterized protein n=1 Tax=Dryococelus australis TaxID=614101 RepID=A0ABQ9HXS9_9NEOP|nr:hypothetical protein PR048_008359 [Dryococelus australis]
MGLQSQIPTRTLTPLPFQPTSLVSRSRFPELPTPLPNYSSRVAPPLGRGLVRPGRHQRVFSTSRPHASQSAANLVTCRRQSSQPTKPSAGAGAEDIKPEPVTAKRKRHQRARRGCDASRVSPLSTIIHRFPGVGGVMRQRARLSGRGRVESHPPQNQATHNGSLQPSGYISTREKCSFRGAGARCSGGRWSARSSEVVGRGAVVWRSRWWDIFVRGHAFLLQLVSHLHTNNPRTYIIMSQNVKLHGGYWLLLRAPGMYSSEQAPAYLATVHHTPLRTNKVNMPMTDKVNFTHGRTIHNVHARSLSRAFKSAQFTVNNLCLWWGSGGTVARVLTSHQGHSVSIPGGFTPRFSHVGIVLGDAACRRVFSGYSSFPPLHSIATPSYVCGCATTRQHRDLADLANLGVSRQNLHFYWLRLSASHCNRSLPHMIFLYSYYFSLEHCWLYNLHPPVGRSPRAVCLAGLESRCERSEVNMGWCRNARAGETGDPGASSDMIPTCENPGATLPGIEPGSPGWEARIERRTIVKRNGFDHPLSVRWIISQWQPNVTEHCTVYAQAYVQFVDARSQVDVPFQPQKCSCKFLHLFTSSTLLKTLRKLRPASFFRSSMLQSPERTSSAKSVGYEETSSSPSGTLPQSSPLEENLLVPSLIHNLESKLALEWSRASPWGSFPYHTGGSQNQPRPTTEVRTERRRNAKEEENRRSPRTRRPVTSSRTIPTRENQGIEPGSP